MSRTEWIEYGQPLSNGRVRATRRTVYSDPEMNDEVWFGSIPMELLKIWERSEHEHDDGSLLLSALDDESMMDLSRMLS